MQNPKRNRVLVAPSRGGILRKGNRNVMPTGRMTVNKADVLRPWIDKDYHGGGDTSFDPSKSLVPPAWLRDQIADRQISGGYTKRNRKCACGILLPNSGICDYCD